MSELFSAPDLKPHKGFMFLGSISILFFAFSNLSIYTVYPSFPFLMSPVVFRPFFFHTYAVALVSKFTSALKSSENTALLAKTRANAHSLSQRKNPLCPIVTPKINLIKLSDL